MDHIVRVLKTEFVTHNVKRFVIEKPDGYEFIPGQATDISINKPGLENELRPFTFTCLPNSDHLEFIIKIYSGHQGMTEKLLQVNAGDELIIHDVFGSIHFKGPGLFIAAGAGITPFIAIFRYLKESNKLKGNALLFANRTDGDIILKNELKQMLGDDYLDVIEVPLSGEAGKRIDSNLIKKYFFARQFFYICGPDKFTEIMVEILMDLGAEKTQIVVEQ
jgi:ferredoxin-NADP reductase